MEQRLPVINILLQGVIMPFQCFKHIGRLCWPYLVFSFVQVFLLEESEWMILDVVCLVGLCVSGVLAVVACHRIFLLDQQSIKQTTTFRWQSRETNYLFSAIGIGIFATLISIPLYFLLIYLDEVVDLTAQTSPGAKNFTYNLIYLPVGYLVSRWSLVLPDSAVDRDNSFSWAWNISDGQSFRLFILIGLIPFATELLFGFIPVLLEPNYFLNLLEFLAWLVVAVIEVCLLSLSYKWIMENN